MIRHSCGSHDTRAIQAWLGHRSTTTLAADKDFYGCV
jgi:hypothetical protein